MVDWQLVKQERNEKMKLKIDWKALGKALWNAVKPVLLGAVGGGNLGKVRRLHGSATLPTRRV